MDLRHQDTYSTDFIDHIEASGLFLQHHGRRFSGFLGSYVSYMCGLQYHPHAEKPVKGSLYACRPEENGGLGVYTILTNLSERHPAGRIGYVPKNVAVSLLQKYGPGISVVCFVFSNSTEKSCQCVYNVFAFPLSKLE